MYVYLKVKQRVFIFGFGGGRSPLALQLRRKFNVHGGAKFLAQNSRVHEKFHE